jgi:hypothetical protein
MKLLLSFSIICLAFISISAQDIPIRVKNHAIGIVPQYSFINGIRTDFDFRVSKNKNQWLVIAPQVFLSPENPNLYNYTNMWGLGLELQHRYYLKPDNNLARGVYMGYGPMFQYFSIEEDRYYTEKVIENGIEYTVVKKGLTTTGIYKFGVTATAGYQATAFNVVYFDFYIGTGIRLSFDDTDTKGFHKIHNNWWGDYGYSGTLLDAGVRIGMLY